MKDSNRNKFIDNTQYYEITVDEATEISIILSETINNLNNEYDWGLVLELDIYNLSWNFFIEMPLIPRMIAMAFRRVGLHFNANKELPLKWNKGNHIKLLKLSNLLEEML